MARRLTHVRTRALLLGILTGGRTATPLAILAQHHDDRRLRGDWQRWPMFADPLGRGILLVAALGELVGDKLPATPARIAPAGLIARAAAGALVGAAIGTTGRNDHRAEGAALGAIGAIGGSFAGWLLRTRAPERIPATAVALAEDAAVIGGSFRTLSR